MSDGTFSAAVIRFPGHKGRAALSALDPTLEHDPIKLIGPCAGSIV
ncbi:hypothetical protein [Nitrobacter winogradskyi]|nr:hypothetical protein [Nitrobacter winogradskyi]